MGVVTRNRTPFHGVGPGAHLLNVLEINTAFKVIRDRMLHENILYKRTIIHIQGYRCGIVAFLPSL